MTAGSNGFELAIAHSMKRGVFLVCALILFATANIPAIGADSRYSAVAQRIEKLCDKPSIVSTKIGASNDGRPIYAVVMTHPSDLRKFDANHTRVLVIAGQHGNETTPVRAAIELMEQLADDPSPIKNLVVAFVPVVNPDGFEALTRANSKGINLNRDWIAASQPETAAVTQLVEKFKPHVLMDLHEWTASDVYSPNCVEVPGFAHTPAERMARILGRAAAAPPVIEAFYREQSDPSLAHRRFTSQGICSLLVETSPKRFAGRREEIYKSVVTTAFSTISAPADPAIAADLKLVKSDFPDAEPWLAELYAPKVVRQSKPLDFSPLWFSMLVMAVCAIVWRTRPSFEADDLSFRLSTADIALSDAPARTKLAMLREHRLRPSDRR